MLVLMEPLLLPVLRTPRAGNGNADNALQSQWQAVTLPTTLMGADDLALDYVQFYRVYMSADNGASFIRITEEQSTPFMLINKVFRVGPKTYRIEPGQKYLFTIKTFARHKIKPNLYSSSYSATVVGGFIGLPKNVVITYLDNDTDITLKFYSIPHAHSYTINRYKSNEAGDLIGAPQKFVRTTPDLIDQIQDFVADSGILAGKKCGYTIDVTSEMDEKTLLGNIAYYGMARVAGAPAAVRNLGVKWSGYFSDRITLEWSLLSSADIYPLFVSRSSDTSTFRAVGTNNEAPYPLSAPNKKFYMPPTGEVENYDGKDYYFRIQGASAEGSLGPLSQLVGAYFGKLLPSPNNANVVSLSDSKKVISWNGKMDVLINRTRTDETVEYLMEDGTWATIDVANMDLVDGFTFGDVLGVKKISDGYFIDENSVDVKTYGIASYFKEVYDAGTKGHQSENATLVSFVENHNYSEMGYRVFLVFLILIMQKKSI